MSCGTFVLNRPQTRKFPLFHTWCRRLEQQMWKCLHWSPASQTTSHQRPSWLHAAPGTPSFLTAQTACLGARTFAAFTLLGGITFNSKSLLSACTERCKTWVKSERGSSHLQSGDLFYRIIVPPSVVVHCVLTCHKDTILLCTGIMFL